MIPGPPRGLSGPHRARTPTAGLRRPRRHGGSTGRRPGDRRHRDRRAAGRGGSVLRPLDGPGSAPRPDRCRRHRDAHRPAQSSRSRRRRAPRPRRPPTPGPATPPAAVAASPAPGTVRIAGCICRRLARRGGLADGRHAARSYVGHAATTPPRRPSQPPTATPIRDVGLSRCSSSPRRRRGRPGSAADRRPADRAPGAGRAPLDADPPGRRTRQLVAVQAGADRRPRRRLADRRRRDRRAGGLEGTCWRSASRTRAPIRRS